MRGLREALSCAPTDRVQKLRAIEAKMTAIRNGERRYIVVIINVLTGGTNRGECPADVAMSVCGQIYISVLRSYFNNMPLDNIIGLDYR